MESSVIHALLSSLKELQHCSSLYDILSYPSDLMNWNINNILSHNIVYCAPLLFWFNDQIDCVYVRPRERERCLWASARLFTSSLINASIVTFGDVAIKKKFIHRVH